MLRHTCFGLVFMLVALGLAIGTRPMQGQTMSFFRQFTTPGMDRATAVAADASGIYVAGHRPAQSIFSWRTDVRKYDSRGNELWTGDQRSGRRSVVKEPRSWLLQTAMVCL